METRVVAVDGLGGAGKSTFAERLVRELGGARVVHTDDFASWEDPIDWWPLLLERVLRPLAENRRASFVPNPWGGPPKPEVLVEPGGFVVLEGVTASREAFRPYLTYAVWIETPRDVRLRRGLERDGEAMRAEWEAWMAAEDSYLAQERPDLRADAVVLGDR